MFVPICAAPLKSMMRSTNFRVDNLTPRLDPLIPCTYTRQYQQQQFQHHHQLQHHPQYQQYQQHPQHQQQQYASQQHEPCGQNPMFINLNYPLNLLTNTNAQSLAPEIMTVPGGEGDTGDCTDRNGSGRTVPLDMHKFRKPAMMVAIIDCIFATSLLVFHGLTLMVQEIPGAEDNWLLPRVPMTPGELTITGYMEVIAWIGIFSINFSQLLVAVTLFNGCDKSTEALKAFEASRLWIKTCVFLIVILFTKLCILYFMYHMEMYAFGTIICTALETLFHAIGIFFVFKFFDEIKENNPMISTIYLTSDENSSPKRNNAVADAVWF